LFTAYEILFRLQVQTSRSQNYTTQHIAGLDDGKEEIIGDALTP